MWISEKQEGKAPFPAFSLHDMIIVDKYIEYILS